MPVHFGTTSSSFHVTPRLLKDARDPSAPANAGGLAYWSNQNACDAGRFARTSNQESYRANMASAVMYMANSQMTMAADIADLKAGVGQILERMG
jgi:hypothetical protein